jgi:MFS transporter, FHS family, L-fucose permease
LFIPAANVRAYGLFLLALFVVASGLTFLETAANPYVTILGTAETASKRINFAQSFNGLAAFLAAYLGSKYILSGQQLSNTEMASYTPDQLQGYLQHEADSVKMPYLIIALLVLLVAFVISRTQLPEVLANGHAPDANGNQNNWRQPHVLWGVAAQLFYVGAQVCVSSFFIRYLGFTLAMPEQQAGYFLSVALLMFMLGRFVGTFLMQYLPAQSLLALYAIINILLLAFVVLVGGPLAPYALVGVEFFMSIMFPTIFSLSLRGLDTAATKTASSYLVMAIVGGAVFPLLMGRLSDASSIQLAYLVPLLCFVVVFLFGWRKYKPV